MRTPLTADESSFQKPKSRAVALFAYKAAADVAAKVVLVAITVVAARRLTPAGFGVFSLGSTLGWMAAVGADFGMQLHLARAVARAPDRAAALLAAWLRVRLWTAAAALGVVVVGVVAARSSADVAGPIAVLALVYAVSGLVEFLHYFYRGLSRSDIESSLTIWQRLATLVFGFAALAWRPTVGTLAIALLIPAVATLLVSLRIASRLGNAGLTAFAEASAVKKPCATSEVAGFKISLVGADPRVRPGADTWVGPYGLIVKGSLGVASGFRRDVAPIGAGILLSALYFRIDIFLVQLWSGTESVALYNAVFRVIEGLRLFPAAALAVALPALCRARDLRPLMNVSLTLVAGACLVTAIAWPAADLIVPFLFGDRYAPAVPAFRILLLSFPLLSLNYALTHQLIGWDGQRAYAGICATALLVNLALNARLIPALSIEGAAWATIGTEVVVTAGCAIALARASSVAALTVADARIG